MKAKLYLALLAINGLIFSANGAAIATESNPNSRSNITHLSQTIAKLVDVEDRTNLVRVAIDRALLAQQVNQPQLTPPVTAGVPRLDAIQTNKDTTQPDNKTPETDKKTTDSDNKTKANNEEIKNQIQFPVIGRVEHKPEPTIRGRVTKPQLQSSPVGYLKASPNAETDRKTSQTDDKTTENDRKSQVNIDLKNKIQLPPMGRYLKNQPNVESDRQNTDRSTST